MKQKRWMLVLVTVGLLILPIHMTAEENQNEPTVQEENDRQLKVRKRMILKYPRMKKINQLSRTGITKTSRLTMDR